MKTLFLTVFALLFCIQSSLCQATVTKGRNIDLDKDTYLFVDTQDLDLRNSILTSFAGNDKYIVFIPKDGSADSPLIITEKRKGWTRDKALQDCLIGAGTFVIANLIAASTSETDVNGFTTINGGAALTVTAISFVSCFFTIKGTVELFKGKSKLKPVSALTEESQSTKNIINYSGLVKTDEKEFDTAVPKSDIVTYIQLQLL